MIEWEYIVFAVQNMAENMFFPFLLDLSQFTFLFQGKEREK